MKRVWIVSNYDCDLCDVIAVLDAMQRLGNESIHPFFERLYYDGDLKYDLRARIVVASSKESFIKLGGSEVTRDVEVFQGKEAARLRVDIAA